MTRQQERELRLKAKEFFKSEEFEEYFTSNHHPWWLLIPIAIIAPLTIVGLPIGLKTWKIILSGQLQSNRLRKRYAALAEKGKFLFTYVLVANNSLKKSGVSSAPALVVGNFNNGADDLKILELKETLASISLGETFKAQFQKTQKVLSDLEFKYKRRRQIPKEISHKLEMIAFDLEIYRDFLSTDNLILDAIPCIAEPGKKGIISMLPSKLVYDALNGDVPSRLSKKSEPELYTQASNESTCYSSRAHQDIQADADNVEEDQGDFRSDLEIFGLASMINVKPSRYFHITLENLQTITDETIALWANMFQKAGIEAPEDLSELKFTGFREGDYICISIKLPTPDDIHQSYHACGILGPILNMERFSVEEMTEKIDSSTWNLFSLQTDIGCCKISHFKQNKDLSNPHFEEISQCQFMNEVDFCSYMLRHVTGELKKEKIKIKPQRTPTSTIACFSLSVLGLIGFGFFCSIPGIILGHIALGKIKKENLTKAKPLTKVGLGLSYAITFFYLLTIAFAIFIDV